MNDVPFFKRQRPPRREPDLEAANAVQPSPNGPPSVSAAAQSPPQSSPSAQNHTALNSRNEGRLPPPIHKRQRPPAARPEEPVAAQPGEPSLQARDHASPPPSGTKDRGIGHTNGSQPDAEPHGTSTKASRRRTPGSDYEVGWGKPPKEHRFQKGQPSRNPSGRPKKSKNLRTVFLDALNVKVKVREGGKTKIMTKWEVGCLRTANNFMETGDLRYLERVHKLFGPGPTEAQASNAPTPQDDATAKAMLSFLEDVVRDGGTLKDVFSEPQGDDPSDRGGTNEDGKE